MSLWIKAQELLKKKLTPTVFNTWIKSIEFIKEENGKIILEVNNKFQKNLIETAYLESIKETLKEIAHKDISILFTLSSKNKKIVTTLKEEFSAPDNSEVTNESQPILTPSGTKKKTVPFIPENMFLQKFTFDNFIVGDSNRVAFSAAKAAANKPGGNYNPLFLFGKRGVGKTHLLQAIGNFVKEKNLAYTVRYTTVDEFANDFTKAINTKDFISFNNKYRNNDILLIDDINLFAGKKGNQTLFLHTFNALYLSGKQIVLTSDRPPNELKDIQARLLNRFEQGLIAEIHSPELELRQKILRQIAKKNKQILDTQQIHYIASRVTNDIRVLEGIMNRLVLETELGKKISFEIIDSILHYYMPKIRNNSITLEQIVKKVVQYYKISEATLLDKRKNKHVVIPRQMAMYLALEFTSLPVTGIAHYFNLSHSSVNYAQRKMKEMLSKDLYLKNTFDKIVADLKDNF